MAPQQTPKPPWPEDHLPPYLTLEEAAAVLRTTVKAVRHLIDRGQLPGVARPHGWKVIRVKTADLLQWLDGVSSSEGDRR